jgi:cytochrome c peroxidase
LCIANLFIVSALVLSLILLCFQASAKAVDKSIVAYKQLAIPASDAKSPESPLIQFGRLLFSDIRFSQNGTISCAGCHKPEKAFTDGKVRAEGINGQTGTRNTPSLLNATYTDAKFWDGRRHSLNEQVLDPFVNPREHGLVDHRELLLRLKTASNYSTVFQAAFGRKLAQANVGDITKGLSAYINSIKPKFTRLDCYLSGKDDGALTSTKQQGFKLFIGRAHCADCHKVNGSQTTLTDDDYHIRGVGFSQIAPRLAKLTKTLSDMPLETRERMIGADQDIASLGRFVLTLRPTDIGKFKTPSLYEVAATGPYMHDGSIPSLEAAVDWELYYRGQDDNQPIILSQSERAGLLAFLRALSTTQNSRPYDGH